MISCIKWFTRNKWVGWSWHNSKVGEETYPFICISKGGHYTIYKQATMDQPSRLGRWTCPICHANSLGASIKVYIYISCGNWEEKGQGLQLIKEVWRRAQFERIIFVAFDGYTFEDKMHEHRSIMDMEVNSIETKLVWFKRVCFLHICCHIVIQTDVIPSNKAFLHTSWPRTSPLAIEALMEVKTARCGGRQGSHWLS